MGQNHDVDFFGQRHLHLQYFLNFVHDCAHVNSRSLAQFERSVCIDAWRQGDPFGPDCVDDLHSHYQQWNHGHGRELWLPQRPTNHLCDADDHCLIGGLICRHAGIRVDKVNYRRGDSALGQSFGCCAIWFRLFYGHWISRYPCLHRRHFVIDLCLQGLAW